jgi:hypothetical protein
MIFLQAALAVPLVTIIIFMMLFFVTIIPIVIYNFVVGIIFKKKDWTLKYYWVLLIAFVVAFAGVAIFAYKMFTFEGTVIN